jgi:Trk-type K+ transport system membrane component
MQRSAEYQTDNQSQPTFIWLVNGLFQIASTRTAGFSVTSLEDIHPAIRVSFLVMMYISAFPTAIAMRETNVYEVEVSEYTSTTRIQRQDLRTENIPG